MTPSTRAVLRFLAGSSSDAPMSATEIGKAMLWSDGRSVTACLVSLHADRIVERTDDREPRGRSTKQVIRWRVTAAGHAQNGVLA